VTAAPGLSTLSHVEKDALIVALFQKLAAAEACIAAQDARIAALEARIGELTRPRLQVHDPAARECRAPAEHRLAAQAPGRTPAA